MEHGIPVWKFNDSKSRYALEGAFSEAKGEFLQLYRWLVCACVIFCRDIRQEGKGQEGRVPSSRMLSNELRTSNGTMMRIQRDMSQDLLLKSAAQVFARIPNGLLEARRGNNVSHRCA